MDGESKSHISVVHARVQIFLLADSLQHRISPNEPMAAKGQRDSFFFRLDIFVVT
jgi:hypothetical protein